MAKHEEKFGLLQWFYFEDRDLVRATASRLRDLGLTRLRTGLSWAEYLEPGGAEWYDYMVSTLAGMDIELLLSVAYTPAELSDNGQCTGLPRRLEDFADFIELIGKRFAGQIKEIQLWNEPNNRHFLDLDGDPGWRRFAQMIGLASARAKQLGLKTMLGGTIAGAGWAPLGPGWPPDAAFFSALYSAKAMDQIDAIAFHSFPGMWVSGDPNDPEHPEWSWGEATELWLGWEAKIAAYSALADGREIVVAETGFSAYDWANKTPGHLDEQCIWLERAYRAPARVYWYSLFDTKPGRKTIGGENGGDPRNPYFGLITADGIEKPAYWTLKDLIRKRPDD
jgi:CDP-paratose 2-epimerase